MELAERNVRVSLVLKALAHGLTRAMRGQEVEALYVPLSEAELQAAA
jgi:DNA polymerase-3 subunit delta'